MYLTEIETRRYSIKNAVESHLNTLISKNKITKTTILELKQLNDEHLVHYHKRIIDKLGLDDFVANNGGWTTFKYDNETRNLYAYKFEYVYRNAKTNIKKLYHDIDKLASRDNSIGVFLLYDTSKREVNMCKLCAVWAISYSILLIQLQMKNQITNDLPYTSNKHK